MAWPEGGKEERLLADLYVSQVSGSNQHRTSTVLVLRVFKGFPENHTASKRSPISLNSLALGLPQGTSGFGLAGKALPERPAYAFPASAPNRSPAP